MKIYKKCLTIDAIQEQNFKKIDYSQLMNNGKKCVFAEKLQIQILIISSVKNAKIGSILTVPVLKHKVNISAKIVIETL